VSDTVIGLTIVAAGTSLPEVMASVLATIRGERDIAVGNVVGSNIYNILAILGLSGAIVPGGLQVSSQMLSFDIPVMIAVAAICYPFFKTGSRLSRWEGALFLAAYVGYTAYLIYKAGEGAVAA
jgi:cation:H+ antiporter